MSFVPQWLLSLTCCHGSTACESATSAIKMYRPIEGTLRILFLLCSYVPVGDLYLFDALAALLCFSADTALVVMPLDRGTKALRTQSFDWSQVLLALVPLLLSRKAVQANLKVLVPGMWILKLEIVLACN